MGTFVGKIWGQAPSQLLPLVNVLGTTFLNVHNYHTRCPNIVIKPLISKVKCHLNTFIMPSYTKEIKNSQIYEIDISSYY